MTVSTPIAPSVQCPQCGSHSVVEYKPTVYHCLKCDFEKDLSQPEPPESNPGSTILAILAAVLGLLFLL